MMDSHRRLYRGLVQPATGRWRQLLAERRPLIWLLALVTGIATAYAILVFRGLIAGVQYLWTGAGLEETMSTAAAALPWWQVLAGPALAGLLTGLGLHFFMKRARPLGVPDVMVANAYDGARIPLGSGLMSALLTALSLGGGASAGREGPAVHLGATLASALVTRFSLPPDAGRILLGCGVAAAVSASFNAPIAGVLFAHEVILSHIAIRAFVPITVSSVAATIITRTHLGDYPAFSIPDYNIATYLEFPAFALLGVLCAIVAITFIKTCFAAEKIGEKIATRFTLPLWSRPVLAGLMVGGLGIAFPQVLGVGYEATDTALKGGYPLMLLVILIAAKILATAITLAGRFGGGVFSPSLYLGAMTGGAFGLLLASFVPAMTSTHGLYAIIGMGAVAGAVLGAPLSTILIAFELTGDYTLTLALMLSIAIATALTLAVAGKSYFHSLLEQRGVFLDEGPHQRILHTVLVSDIMRPAGEAGDLTGWRQAPQTSGQALYADDRLDKALTLMERYRLDSYPVSEAGKNDEDFGRIISIVAYRDALKRFNDELIAANLEAYR